MFNSHDEIIAREIENLSYKKKRELAYTLESTNRSLDPVESIVSLLFDSITSCAKVIYKNFSKGEKIC